MADEIAQTEVETTEAAPEQKVIDPAEHAKVLAALKEANKEAADRRKKLDAFEKADVERKQAEMTESEKAVAKIKEYESELAQLKRKELLRKVADEVGLPSTLAERLQGSTEEEVKADAVKLLELVPKIDQKKPNLQASNPGTAERSETLAEKRERLMGSPIDIWAGGGVRWPPKE